MEDFLSESFSTDNYSFEFSNMSLGDEDGVIKSLLNSSRRMSATFRTEDKEYIFDRLFVRAIFITVYTIVFCSCFFGNLLVILLVTLHWRMRSITNFCLANLAFANLCVGVFCIYQNLSTYLITSWVFGDFMCKMYHFINSLSYTASILILVVICIERYLAIIHPLRFRQLLTMTRLRVRTALFSSSFLLMYLKWFNDPSPVSITAVWVISAIYCSPRLYYITTITMTRNDGETETLCIPKRTLYDSATFDVINFLMMFLVPLLVISVLYTMIGITLWKSSCNQMKAPPSTSARNPVAEEADQTFEEEQGEGNNKANTNKNRTRRKNPLNALQSLCRSKDEKARSSRNSTASTPSPPSSSSILLCLGRTKRKEANEWGWDADSSSKSNKSSRPSLILTDAQDVDHVLLESEDIISVVGVNGIPSISATVDINHTRRTTYIEENERSLRRNEMGNKRRLKLNEQDNVEDLCSKVKFKDEVCQDSNVFFRSNKKNRVSELRRNALRFGERTSFSQNKCNGKYRVKGDSTPQRTGNGILKLNSKRKEQVSGDSSPEEIPLSTYRRVDTGPTLKRTGAMKANRIGAQALKSRRRVIRMLIAIVVTFAICNLPFHGRKLWQIFSSSYRGGSVFSTLFTPITFLIMYANCAINPILYAFMSANFRERFKDLLCCRLRHQMDKRHRRVRSIGGNSTAITQCN